MRIRRCKNCATYTLKKSCPSCGGKTVRAGPGPYIFKNKWSKYRRKLKRKND